MKKGVKIAYLETVIVVSTHKKNLNTLTRNNVAKAVLVSMNIFLHTKVPGSRLTLRDFLQQKTWESQSQLWQGTRGLIQLHGVTVTVKAGHKGSIRASLSHSHSYGRIKRRIRASGSHSHCYGRGQGEY